MPPSTPSTAMFQRGGTVQRRLTKLYSDTKQSYASANVTPTSTYAGEDPDILAVRRDFQVQYDRLLAWGLHWTDTKAAEARYQGKADVEIDKQLALAGHADIVADTMSEIQRLLEESGRLQHPERYLASMSAKSPRSPSQSKKEWTTYEGTTARALLDQLVACIDVLYDLIDLRRTANQSEKWDQKVIDPRMSAPKVHQHPEQDELSQTRRKRPRLSDEKQLPQEPIYRDPLFIEFNRLALIDTSPHDPTDPPPYEEISSSYQTRPFGLLNPEGTPVLVDFVDTLDLSDPVGASINVETMRSLVRQHQRVSFQELSCKNHSELLGFTVDRSISRLGFVYAVPGGSHQSSSRQQKTLAAIIADGRNGNEPTSPTLENRFRLAYNVVVSTLSYLASGMSHHHINGNNIIYDIGTVETNVRIWQGIRDPMLLPPSQSILVTSMGEEPLSMKIYRHPTDNPINIRAITSAHEIYSLGMVLLEVGLWMPLAKLWKSKYDRTSFMIKVKNIYVHNLASKCGSRYMRVVQKCLSAPQELLPLIEQAGKTGGTYDAAAYLLNIAHDLAKCCAIDDDGPPPVSDLDYLSSLLMKKTSTHGQREDDNGSDTPMTPSSMADEDVPNAIITSTDLGQTALGPRAVLRKWPEVDIPQDDLDQWNVVLMPRLSKMLQTSLQNSPESCSVSLMMVGASADSAKTTICIQCQDTTRVHDALRRRFKPKRGWGVVVLKGDVKRSGRRKTKERQTQSECKSPQIDRLREQFYQERPSCGASIGAFKDGEHLPPVSFGGTILVDGKPFGMTVHHMLDDASDGGDGEQSAQRSAAVGVQGINQLGSHPEDFVFMQPDDATFDVSAHLELSDDDDGGSDTSTIRPDYSAFDADGNEFWFLEDTPDLDDDHGSSSSSERDDEDDTASIGDRSGVSPFDDDVLHITQPAIDDIDEDFFPSAEDRDDDHLASHSFGHVHASSGIRRVISGDMKHEVDWALIKIQEERLRVGNEIRSQSNRRPVKSRRSSRSHSLATADPVLESVAPSQTLSGTEVYCCGRSSGFRKGRIGQAMALVKLHGRQSFSSSWCVEGGFGVPGDSGAWVYDPLARQLCGHVLAWGDKSKTAYIAPMDVLFSDIKEILGAESVSLPCAADSGSLSRGKNEVNEQLQKSRDIEVSLRELNLSQDIESASGAPPGHLSPLAKDVPDTYKGLTRGQDQGVAMTFS